jgi:ABC-type transporter MlaC component
MFYFDSTRVAPTLALALVCALSAPAVAEVQDTCPGQASMVSESVSQAFRSLCSLHRNALPGPVGVTLREEKTSSLIVEHIASQRFASELLRGSWETASVEQQSRWERVLGALLSARVSRALRTPLRYEMSVADVKVATPCGEANARLTLRERVQDRQMEIALKLVKLEPGWRVWDLATDGASLVKTWRPRFQTVVRERGVAGLESELAHLATRLGVRTERRPSATRP